MHVYAVTFAKLFFPSVAQLFMRIAGAEFAGSKLKDVGLNESLDWRFRERFDALTRTGLSIPIMHFVLKFYNSYASCSLFHICVMQWS